MLHMDLCSGIGGFALAAQWMEWQTIQFVEIDSFCQKVLAKNFPGVPIHDDLKTFDATKFLGFDGILTAGWPCQPFSQAGRRQGEKDPRHLWPEVFRIIKECRPRFIVGENVAGHITMGLDAVLSDLEAEGYASQAVIIPACATGAPHRRDRVWIIAHDNRRGGCAFGQGENQGRTAEPPERGRCTSTDATSLRRQRPEPVRGSISASEREGGMCEPAGSGEVAPDATHTRSKSGHFELASANRQGEANQSLSRCQDVSHTDRERHLQPQGTEQDERRWTSDTGTDARHPASERLPDWAGGTFRQPSPLTEFERSSSDGKEREIERYFCDVDDGVPKWMARPVRDRVSKLKALGNAIVPQVAYEIFRAIDAADRD